MPPHRIQITRKVGGMGRNRELASHT
jgi:hypothetical protein